MRKQIDNYLGKFLAFLMLIMTLDVLYGVLTRYVFGAQASWTEELARFLLIWIGILGAAHVSGKQMHLAIDLLKPKLSPKSAKLLDNFIKIIVILFALTVLIIGGVRLMYITQTLGQLSPALRVPMSFIYSVVPLSGILVIYYQVQEILTPGVEESENVSID
ncbi:MAG TPA: TRAP transporter small permease [Saprospiraceae bacterium]|nr:TRAP transporter small permease [Saprospiraceae bacterium]